MDTTDCTIRFDDAGICNLCTAAIARMGRQLLPPAARAQALHELVRLIQHEGRNREYDCVIGVSGGVDSTATAYWVHRMGLRPVAVHFDNGWDSELAVDNIKRMLDAYKIELYTHVVNWEEFRDLQLSFLRASLANCEAPTDHAITALLFQTARRVGTRFILSGSNLVSEALMPTAWGHHNQDLRLLKAVHRRFGSVPLKTMPTISIGGYLYYVFGRGIRQIPFLNYVEYDKQKAKKLLAEAIGWRDYGGKHHESVWTRFFQGHYLPAKFGYDKRKAHLSSLICSGQMTREEALEELARPIYDPVLLELDTAFVLKKLGLSAGEFSNVMATPPKQAADYPNNNRFFLGFAPLKNAFRSIATRP